jgi:hypothetical protein
VRLLMARFKIKPDSLDQFEAARGKDTLRTITGASERGPLHMVPFA